MRQFKNKRILITAGPTWVPIDRVRVISNIATGETGILLAKAFRHSGANVTLVLGPVNACCLEKNIKLIHFKFFNELRNIIVRELRANKYDAMIHSAAVSDYRPLKSYNYKIKSGIKKWKLNLIPTIKIINLIKKINPALCLVGFKFEARATENILIKEAKNLMREANLDLAVANTIDKTKYLAYILEGKNIYGPLFSREKLVQDLGNIIREKI